MGGGERHTTDPQVITASSDIKTVPVPLQMSSIAEYMNLAQEAFGAFNAMMTHLPSQERQSVWAEEEER